MTYARRIPASLETPIVTAIERVLRDAALGRVPGFAVSDQTGEVSVTISPVKQEEEDDRQHPAPVSRELPECRAGLTVQCFDSRCPRHGQRFTGEGD